MSSVHSPTAGKLQRKRYSMIVGGESLLAEEEIPVRNPADKNEIVGYIPKADRQQVGSAVDAAYQAFNSDWSLRKNSRLREKVMRKAVNLIEKDLDDLSITYTREQGKPLLESRSELESFVDVIDFFAGYGGKLYGSENITTLGNDDLWVLDRPTPLGVIAAITPWNFELSLLGWKLAPALICGNTVVIKPSTSTPITTIKVVEHFYRADLPKGVMNVVTGNSSVVGDALVSNKKIRKVAFTGSTAIGKHVYDLASKDIKDVTLELGGSDPTIVCDDADLEDAARTIVEKGRFRNAGQSCTSVKRLYVFDSIADEFLELLQKYTSRLKLGNGLDPKVTMGPLHNEEQRNSVKDLVDDAVNNYGGKVLTGGSIPQGVEFSNGYFYEPTILKDIAEDARIWTEECFGPALPVARVKNLEDAINRANKSTYGLGASVWTKSLVRAYKFLNEIESGIVWVNSPPLSVPQTSFGGVKDSGIGRELGERAIAENMEPKSIRIKISSIAT